MFGQFSTLGQGKLIIEYRSQVDDFTLRFYPGTEYETWTNEIVWAANFGCASSFLYFDPPSLLRSKLYFDQNFTSTFSSRPIRSPDFTKGRSTEVKVRQSKSSGRSTENSRSTEKVELMRTPFLNICIFYNFGLF